MGKDQWSSQGTLSLLPSPLLTYRNLSSLQDLVRRLLHVDPHKRPTARQIELHGWISERRSLPEREVIPAQPSPTVKKQIEDTYRYSLPPSSPSPLPPSQPFLSEWQQQFPSVHHFDQLIPLLSLKEGKRVSPLSLLNCQFVKLPYPPCTVSLPSHCHISALYSIPHTDYHSSLFPLSVLHALSPYLTDERVCE